LAKLTGRVNGETRTIDRPYQDLYIYLIKGLMQNSDEAVLGDTFLGNWVEEETSFLFFTRPAGESVSRLLKSRSDLELVDDYYFTYEQWQGGGLKPVRVDNFVVVPPWEKMGVDEGGIQIVLDPGVVFGNALHPTTRDCLRALACAGRQMPFKRVLDLGTGTGVLALAAAILGAQRVLAVDINPLCVKTAIKNVRLNDLHEIIQVVNGPAEDFVDEVADLVVANIHHEVINGLLDSEGFCDIDRIIISGLMRSQSRDVKTQLESNHFRILREWDHDMIWFTLLAKKGPGQVVKPLSS